MALILNEEQKMLKDSANEFLAANAPVEQFRTLRIIIMKPLIPTLASDSRNGVDC